MDYVDEYMSIRKNTLAFGTYKRMYARYRRQNRDIIRLRSIKKISSTSPAKMKPEDVRAYILYRLSLELSNKEMSHDISALSGLFTFAGNIALQTCLQRDPSLKPYGRAPRLPSMDHTDIVKIFDTYGSCPKDWKHIRAYSLVFLCISCGLRNKEVRLANVSDLDTETWMLNIVHVKGEDTYGEPRTVPVRPEIRPILSEYLALRTKMQAEQNVNNSALFFSNDSRSEDGHLSANSLRIFKKLVETESGVDFDLRKCRRTFGQEYLDADLDIESVSVLMGHLSTKTTEGYYCRKRNDAAIKAAQMTWDSNNNKNRVPKKVASNRSWCRGWDLNPRTTND